MRQKVCEHPEGFALGQTGKPSRRIAAALGLLAAILLSACGRSESPYVKSVEQTPSGFFRVFADIRVKETGEIVKLDYVVACGGTVTNWSYTTSSVSFGMAPHIMLVPTSSGELIGARTPSACDASMWEPRRVLVRGEEGSRFEIVDPVPDDFLPLLMWYPDADDIGFAIGYLSDLAYQSPYSKMELIDSGIAKSSLEEWKAWREEAEQNYKQVGNMPGPWGYQIPGRLGSSPEMTAELESLNGGRRISTDRCYSLALLQLPESIKSDILALLPETPRDWVTLPEVELKSESAAKRIQQLLFHSENVFFNGGSYVSHTKLYVEDGVRRSTGGGAFSHNQDGDGSLDKNDFYHDTYPILLYQRGDSTAAGSNVWDHKVLFDENWKGFGMCGLTSPSEEDLLAYVEGRSDDLPLDYEKLDFRDLNAATDIQRIVSEGDVLATNLETQTRVMITSTEVRPIIKRDGAIVVDCCSR